jgi:hypothetical protein
VRLTYTPLVPAPLDADPALAPLLAGSWVEDLGHAPPEFAPSGTPARLLDGSPVLETVRSLELAARSPEGAQIAFAPRNDPKSPQYIRNQDKFPQHPEDGVRYDIIPGSYDPVSVFGRGIPNDLHGILDHYFLYVSYWFKDGRVTRVERFFDIDTARVRRDVEGVVKRTGENPGETDRVMAKLAPFRATFTFTYPSRPVGIAAPAAAAAIALPGLRSAAPPAAAAGPPPVPGLTPPAASNP